MSLPEQIVTLNITGIFPQIVVFLFSHNKKLIGEEVMTFSKTLVGFPTILVIFCQQRV